MEAYKVCPSCGVQAPLAAPNCTGCGHKYRTQFVGPNATQAFASPVVAPRVIALPVVKPVVWGVAVAAILAYLVWAFVLPSGRSLSVRSQVLPVIRDFIETREGHHQSIEYFSATTAKNEDGKMLQTVRFKNNNAPISIPITVDYEVQNGEVISTSFPKFD